MGREPTFVNFELMAANPSRADALDMTQMGRPSKLLGHSPAKVKGTEARKMIKSKAGP